MPIFLNQEKARNFWQEAVEATVGDSELVVTYDLSAVPVGGADLAVRVVGPIERTAGDTLVLGSSGEGESLVFESSCRSERLCWYSPQEVRVPISNPMGEKSDLAVFLDVRATDPIDSSSYIDFEVTATG